MDNVIIRKFRKFRSNLNIRRTVLLVWSVTKSWTIITVAAIIVETLFFLATIFSLRLLINAVSQKDISLADHEHLILRAVIVSAVAGIGYIVVKAISAYITEVQASKVAIHIDDKIHKSAVELDYAYFESPDYFDILKRAKDAGADKPHLIIVALIEIVKNFMILLSLGFALVTINWLLLPMLALFVFPTLLVRIHFANKLNSWRIAHTAIERQSSYLSELITSNAAAKEIRAFSLGNYFKELYLKIRLELLAKRMQISFKSTQKEIITTAMASLGFFCCIGLIAIETLEGKTTVGDITMFLIIFPQTFSMMQNISGGISVVYQNNMFVNSIFELFDLKNNFTDIDSPVDIPKGGNLDLELKNVTFKYPHTGKPVLKDISLKVPSGKIIAIVGLNGAGKSTLIKLICRLYDPSAGSITYGGTDVRSFQTSAYRKQIGTVFQDFQHYNVSVADNIRFGDLDKAYSKDNIENAAKSAGADEFIDDFPKGYDTMMGRLFEDGQEISIGQWQKLVIARSFYSSANFLIFDEATSAMDTVSEKKLLDKFRVLIDKRAAIVISHRHSAVKYADYIYVLSDGKIIQEGTDKELLSVEGEYARLFKNNIQE